MKSFLFFLFFSATVAISANANAGIYTCQGPVTFVEVNTQGQVVASLGGLNQVTFCQIGATANGISSDSCKAMYAMLLAARINGISVRQLFNDSSTCSAHPSWTYLTVMWGGPHI